MVGGRAGLLEGVIEGADLRDAGDGVLSEACQHQC